MTKKILIAIGILFSLVVFSSTVFATDELQKAGDGIRNFVGGAENVVEDAAKGAGDAVKSGANTIGGSTKNAMTAVTNSTNSNYRSTTGANNNGYSASRTSADATFAGMSGNMWTWTILAIVGVAIIALVWYYTAQNKTEVHEGSDEE